jgi:hypothetical protein
MVFPVHLQRSAVVAIVDCSDRGQFIGSLSLKQAALQWIWLFQEFLISSTLAITWPQRADAKDPYAELSSSRWRLR